jgi:hypothetical protein
METVVVLTASMWLQMVKTFLDLVSQHQNTPQLNQSQLLTNRSFAASVFHFLCSQ